MVLGSDEDFSPISAIKKNAVSIPNEQPMEIEDAIHALPMEKPKEFNKTDMDFLSKLT
ncbi:MAG: hypothetical protein ACFFG0_14945 [Candidatus Thorarchaeota archaeon]